MKKLPEMQPETNANADADYCRQLVRSRDIDRYLATLLAPAQKQRQLFAIYAFICEIEQIPAEVSEAKIGEIRLQWWLDMLDVIYSNDVGQTPVIRELAFTVRTNDLPKHLFAGIIDAHRFELHDEPMPDIATLVDYQNNTAAAAIDLAARILINYGALELSNIISLAGVAHGLTKLLLNLPHHVARQNYFLPVDMLRQHDIGYQATGSRSHAKSVDLVVAQISHTAQQNLSQARQREARLQKEVLPAFMPVSICDLYFKKLKVAENSALVPITNPLQWRKQLHLMKLSFFEQF